MKSRQRYKSLFEEYRYRFGKGKCGYCGVELSGRRRYWCSDDCVNAMHILGKDWPTLRRKVLKENPNCASCTKPRPEPFWHSDGWVVDHIIPISIGGEEFEESNLQLLCPECNKIKTANDMKDIALQRRNEKELERYVSDIIEFNKTKKLYEFYEQNTRKSDQRGL